MGQITPPPSGRVYFDANVLIYFVEEHEPYFTASLPLWDAFRAGQIGLETSELTLLEVLVKPAREGNDELGASYRTLFTDTGGIIVHPVTRAVLERAALVRADHRLRTPDAIHAATAIRVGSPLFLTNDSGFRKVSGRNVAILDEIVAA